MVIADSTHVHQPLRSSQSNPLPVKLISTSALTGLFLSGLGLEKVKREMKARRGVDDGDGLGLLLLLLDLTDSDTRRAPLQRGVG